jgi:hypothetical protein
MDGTGRGRKERVIHTRVPESLDDEIKRRAGSLGLSVSNLVRNILENTFGLVEDIVADGAEIARSARGETLRESASPRASRVLGWTVAVLNVNAICDGCNAMLPKGTRAGIGVVQGSGAAPFRCQDCLEEVTDDRGTSDSRD